MIQRKFEIIRQTLPPSPMILGYGSGVFAQDGYSSNESTVIDLIVVSEHRATYIEYLFRSGVVSWSSKLVSDVTDPEIIFFTDVVLRRDVVVKIGVTEVNRFVSRLRDWDNSFYIPGRMQKPTKLISCDSPLMRDVLNESQCVNLPSGLAAAALLATRDDRSLPLSDIFASLVNLSYLGDIRMGLAENPIKIRNIVNAQMGFLTDMYGPYFDAVGIRKMGNGTYNITSSPQDLWNMLPRSFTRGAIQHPDPRKALRATLSSINRRESFHQALVGIGTSGVSKSINYLARKVSKRFR